MTDWRDEPIVVDKPGLLGWALVALRGLTLGAVTYGGLLLLLLLRLIERPLFGPQRPITPFITQFVCRAAFVILRMPIIVRGQPMRQKGAVVANHASWLDIFALNAAQRIYFVSKSEVASWPAIGWLARATGTVFINRKGTEAKAQQEVFEARLRAATWMLAGSFAFSSVMNYVLATWIVTSPTGSAAFNEELGRLALLSYPAIALPATLMMLAVLYYLARGMRRFASIGIGEALRS
jgi:hypothetical protein